MFSFWKRRARAEGHPPGDDNESAKRADELWKQGSRQLANKNYKRAIATFREAYEIEPSRLDGRLNLGAALYMAGEPAEAIGHLRYVLALEPQNTMALLNLAACLDKTGDLDGSVETLERLVAERPTWRDAHYNLAVALYKQQNYDKAAEALRAELRINPEHELARDLLNEIHLMLPHQKKPKSAPVENTDPGTSAGEPSIEVGSPTTEAKKEDTGL